MIVVMSKDVSQAGLKEVLKRIEALGCQAHISVGKEKTIVGVIDIAVEDKSLLSEQLQSLSFVENIIHITSPYKLVSRHFKPESTIIKIKETIIGSEEIVVIAGPCSVESREQILETARIVKDAGAVILRGGAFKPRTSPYSFQGLGEEGLKLLAEAREQTGLLIATEVTESKYIELISSYADILQVGARNMSSFDFLKEVAQSGKPILLKRGMAATLDEFMCAAEYILSKGNKEVILCERGIRTFETYTRNTLDLSLIPAVKNISHLPIIVDPSHGTGRWNLVIPMALASIAAGADGIMIEVHPQPDRALSDGAQSLTPKNFQKLMDKLRPLCTLVGRKLPSFQCSVA